MRERRLRDGIIVHSSAKKALVPVEKDDNYGYTYRERLPNGQRLRRDLTKQQPTLASNKERRKGNNRATMYEEVDIGSHDDDFEEESSSVAIDSAARRNRCSLPNYLQGRHEDDDLDALLELPDDFRDR